MAALACCNCERPAVCSCVCCFPLPLLCQEHRLSHSADSHFHLPANAVRHVQNIEIQTQLNERVIKLRKQLSLINLYSDPQQQPAIDIRNLLMQFDKDMEEFKMEAKEFKADLVSSEEVKNEWNVEGAADILTSLVWNESTPESEFGTWMDIAHGLKLKDAFQYEESCRVLDGLWKLVQSNKRVETLVLGLVVSEVMGLHIGRFNEALVVVEKSLEVAHELYPKSEITLQLSNMKAALFINFSDSEKNRDFCNQTVLSFRDASLSEVSFGTALYFCITTYLFNGGIPEPEIKSLIEEWAAKTDDSDNRLIEHIRLYLTASLKITDRDYNGAENLMKNAKELAHRYFPTSIYAVLSWLMMSSLKLVIQKIEGVADFPDDERLRTYFPDDERLLTHFPANIVHVTILEGKAQLYNSMGDTAKEIEVRLSMHLILQMNLNCEPFVDNISKLADAYNDSDNKEAALNICESAYCILLERAFASPAFQSAQSSLSYMYQSMGQPEKELEIYAETMRKFQATDSTNPFFSEMLTTLAKWRENTQKDKAIQICIDSYQFLKEKYPSCENYFNAVQTLSWMYTEMGQQEKVEEVVLDCVQIAKSYHKFKGYANLIYSLEENFNLSKFSQNNRLNIQTEIYEFLVSNPSSDCYDTARIIRYLFSDEPEKLLMILLGVYRTLLASPTDPAMKEYLEELTTLYKNMNQLEKALEMRLEVHQLLLDHLTCENFVDNVRVIASCYWNQKQRDKAIQFQIEMIRLLSVHPTSKNYKNMLILLTNDCYSERRLDIALEQYAEAYRTLQPATNPEHNWIVRPLCTLHVNMGNLDTAIQIVQQNMNSHTVLQPAGRDNLDFLTEIYRNSSKFKEVSCLYFDAIQTYYQNGYCDEIGNSLHDFFGHLQLLEEKYRMIEAFLEIISGLKKVKKEQIYMKALNYLLKFCENKVWGSKEEFRMREKIVHYLLSCDPRDTSSVPLLRQIGGFLWGARKLEKAEACYFRGVQIELQRPADRYQVDYILLGGIKDLRLVFNGNGPSRD